MPGSNHKVLKFWYHETSPIFIFVILLCIQHQIQVQMCEATHFKELFLHKFSGPIKFLALY